MGFKIIKQQEQTKQFCELVQNKIDIAREFNTTYELTDEDKRIQALYDNNQLKTSERIRSLSRIKRQEDGKECLLISKQVVFTDKVTGLYRDRYSTVEGITELPLTTTNADGVTEASQIRLVYDIPFTKEKVLETVRKAGTRTIEYRFYEGPETGNRIPRDMPMVGNLDFFTDATWEELLLGREKKIVSSRLNRLDEVRSGYKTNKEQQPLPPTLTDTNKLENEINIKKEDIENGVQKEPKQEGSGGGEGTTKASGTVIHKLKVSNPSTNKKD